MKKWKISHFCLFIVLCVLLNFGGRILADKLNLPLWLDSLGTIMCAYIAGPVCGCIVGITGNLLYAASTMTSPIYCLTSIVIAVVVGFAAKRKLMESWFGAITIGAVIGIASVAVSVPLDLLFYNGSTGNIWGDGVVVKYHEMGVPHTLCVIIGQFYLDFLDKLVSVLLVYWIKLIYRKITYKKISGHERAIETAAKGLTVLAVILWAFFAVPAPTAEAEVSQDVEFTNYVQTVYSSSNGLPCGEANDIAQTNDGILWIGTYAGLYRYNGREFRWMDKYDSVRNVNCLYVDKEGRLWIGTNDNGFSISINEKITTIIDQDHGLPSNSVRSIIQSSDGYYYIGTTGSMQVLTLNSGLKHINTLREVYYADHIATDQKGHVAAVTNNGRLFLMSKGQILSSRQLTEGNEIFRSCCFDDKGRLLAGTTAGHIYVFEISTGGFKEIGVIDCGNLTTLKDLYMLESGELIIAADNGAGYLDNSKEYHNINTNDFNNSIDNVLTDYQGNLWFTSSRLGLLRMAPSAFRDVYGTIGMESRVVNAVTFWQGNYYFGTDKGLDITDADCRTRITNELTEKLKNIRIRCLTAASSGSLWICTYGNGVIELEKDGTEHLYNSENGGIGNRSRVVIELSDGTILAGCDTGISFIRDHKVIRTIGYADGLINSMILTATELPDGRILAGTDGDGIAILENGEVSRMLTRVDGLSSEVILRTVYDTDENGVFIVTSNGLCYMDSSEKIRLLDNFPYFNNYDLHIRDGAQLFVMSSAGIYIMDKADLLSGKPDINYELLDASRGLNSSITANSWHYIDANGNLYLPCDTGVFIFNTGNYSEFVKAYRMSVASLRLDVSQTGIERGMPIMISREVSKIEMFPEIINYSIQDPYVGYYLEGFDSGWTIQPEDSLNTIVYTNLPSGEYVFHLAVFDNNQQHILGERTYKLIKEKAFYDNQWFTIYMVAVPMAAAVWLTYFIVRRRTQRQLEKQQRELEAALRQVQMGNDTITAIAQAVDAKDERTSQHSSRVSLYSVLIAQELGMSEAECNNLRQVALMHDIGKIGIPDAILNKPARLTDEEYAIMKSHTTRGAEILKNLTLIDHVIEGALYHHERFDGRGYPNGLKGFDIPLFARIIGVADAFDAMTANRIYRKQMDFSYVLNEMKNGRGTQFDPQMVDILLKLVDDGIINLNDLYNVKPDEEDKAAGEGASA